MAFIRRNLLIYSSKTLRITALVDPTVRLEKKILEFSLTEEINQGVLIFNIRIDSGALSLSFYHVVTYHLVSS